MMSTEELTTNQAPVEWSKKQASSLLTPLGNRWLHVQGVVKKAHQVSRILDENEQARLIAAAYLHDIGYASSLLKTGFHPLDGACYLRSHNQESLASLIAYHSEAQFEAHLRGLEAELKKFPREYSLTADALTYCDMTTSSTGKQVSFQERLDDIFSRYDKTHVVFQAIKQATSSLSAAVERTQQALNKHRFTE